MCCPRDVHALHSILERSVTDTDGHDKMIDGAPAAHLTQRLKDLIESGYDLDDSTIELEQTVAPGTSNKS